jgi:hypothetical protein
VFFAFNKLSTCSDGGSSDEMRNAAENQEDRGRCRANPLIWPRIRRISRDQRPLAASSRIQQPVL